MSQVFSRLVVAAVLVFACMACGLQWQAEHAQADEPAAEPECFAWIVDMGLVDYISAANSSCDAFEVALLLQQGGEAHGIDPYLLACLAKPESTYRIGVRGSAGEMGLLQIHGTHRARMKRNGLSFDSEADRVRFGALMIREALDSGKTLRQALRPWTVRDSALRAYNKLNREWKF